MFNAFASGLGQLTVEMLIVVLIATAISQVIAVVPGLGGIMAMVLILPFTYSLEPMVAIGALLAAAVTAGTGNTITGVLFGVPGSAMGVATVFDGYPMAQRGEAGRAMGAGLMASFIGGLIGAVALIALIPVVRPIVRTVGPAEFFVLILVALLAISSISEGDTINALLSGLGGLMLAFVGQEPSTGTLRYTFGALYLWDGLQLVPVIIGLFALSEMVDLIRTGNPIASEETTTSTSGVMEGVRDVFRHWRITVSSSLVGVGVGILPGMGGVASQFLAYAQAQKMSKNPDMFGKGAVEGVIGSDAATNSKDGGSLVPTLAFAIPGSAPMAILLGAFIIFGIQPGPTMLTERLDIVWLMIIVLVIANFFAAAICLPFAGTLAKLTRVRASVIVPAVLVISLFGAYLSSNRMGDIVVALLFGLVGYTLRRFRYARATLVVGLVLGGILEHNYLLMVRLYGWEALTRPPVLAIVIAGIVIGAVSGFRNRNASAVRARAESIRAKNEEPR